MTKKEFKNIQERFFEKVSETPFLINKLKTWIPRPWYVLEFQDYIFIPKEVSILIFRKNNQSIPATAIAKAYWITSSKDYYMIDLPNEVEKYKLGGFFILGYRLKYPKVIIY